VTISPRDDA